MSTDAEDRSTWPRDGQVIRREELLRLIEENGGPEGLDLRGAVFVGEGSSNKPSENPIELTPEVLAPLVEAYRQAHGGANPAWLSRAGGIRLVGAQLQGARLSDAHLQGAYLDSAHLQGAVVWNAYLQGAQLVAAQLQGAELIGAQLQGAKLMYAQLQGAQLCSAQLKEANLWRAQLQGANLWGAQLQGAFLWEAQLQGANLWGVEFQRVDMYGVVSLDAAHWYGAFLDHTRMRRESLGKAIGDELEAHRRKRPREYHEAKEGYLLLKNNFNQIGRYEDASWAYVKEQQMEKMAFHWEWRSHGWQVWRAWGSLWRWLRNWFYELSTGYGERPWNAVLCGLGAVLAFAVGFWATGVAGGRGPAAFFDSLVYSIATFATFNLARPGLNPEGRGVEIFSSLEAILGIGVLALVVFTVGNRMSRG